MDIFFRKTQFLVYAIIISATSLSILSCGQLDVDNKVELILEGQLLAKKEIHIVSRYDCEYLYATTSNATGEIGNELLEDDAYMAYVFIDDSLYIGNLYNHENKKTLKLDIWSNVSRGWMELYSHNAFGSYPNEFFKFNPSEEYNFNVGLKFPLAYTCNLRWDVLIDGNLEFEKIAPDGGQVFFDFSFPESRDYQVTMEAYFEGQYVCSTTVRAEPF